jgi:hypothetical protein
MEHGWRTSAQSMISNIIELTRCTLRIHPL